MKIAIVCDWLVTLGGAEKVLAEIITCFPEADLFAVVDVLPVEKRKFLLNKKVNTTFIQQLPFAKKRYRSYLPFMPLAIEQLDLSSYDLIISSSHAVAKGVITGPNQVHISYVHSPMRYAWDLQHQYLRESGLDKKTSMGFLARFCLHKLRMWDVRSAYGVDHFIANSNYIAKRIEKTYRRQSTVIYPPVNVSEFKPSTTKENFYVTASRLVPYKRVDLIVSAFNTMPDKKLIVIGDGPELKKIKSLAKSNIEILGYQSNEKLIHYLQRACAFVFAAEEDFGIVSLEAQACGTPVIAFGKGGSLETINGLDSEKPTGLFFSQQTIDSVCQAIVEFETNLHQFKLEYCVENAQRFSPEQFRNELKNFVASHLTMQTGSD